MTHPGHHTVPSLPILDVALELAGPLPGVLGPGLADAQPALVIIVVSLNSDTQSGPLCHSSVSSLVVGSSKIMNQNLWKIAIQIGRHIGGMPEFQINNSPQHSSWLRKINVF